MIRRPALAVLLLSLPASGALVLRQPGGAAGAAEKPPPPPPPAYPRVSLSAWYEVDPSWPQRPAGAAWGETPGVAVDALDRVWVFTRAEPPVQVYTTSGRFLRSWGTGRIHTAHHLKIDSRGNVWVADIGHHVVMQFTPEGRLLRTLGTRGSPGVGPRHLNQPTDMAVTPAGEVYVSDGYGNNRIVHFDRHGRFVRAWGKLGTGLGEFSLPHAITADSRGRLYVADRNNARIQVFSPRGEFLAQWRNLVVPWGFWMTPSDDLWVCGSSPMPWRKGDEVLGCPPRDQLFMRLGPDGRVRQLWTVPKGEDGRERPGECNWVHAVALDSRGNLYAGDIIGKRVQKFLRR